VVFDDFEILFPFAAVERQHLEVRGESLSFQAPIGHEAGRRDHQGRPVGAAALLLDQDVGQRLHGLAETHVIREDAAEFDLAQELQPAQPFFLIEAKLPLEARWRRHRLDFPCVAQPSPKLQQSLAAEPAKIDRLGCRRKIGEVGRLCRVQAKVAVLTERPHLEQLEERRQQRPEPFAVQRQDAAVVKRHEGHLTRG
jgi:hypothetical protein